MEQNVGFSASADKRGDPDLSFKRADVAICFCWDLNPKWFWGWTSAQWAKTQLPSFPHHVQLQSPELLNYQRFWPPAPSVPLYCVLTKITITSLGTKALVGCEAGKGIQHPAWDFSLCASPWCCITAINIRISPKTCFTNTHGSIIPSATTGFNVRCGHTADKNSCPA